MFDTYDMRSFGLRLKQIRNNLNISQEQAAELAKISCDTLRNIEKGKYVARFDTYNELSKYYKVNVIQLFDFYRKSENMLTIYNLIETSIANESTNTLEEALTLLLNAKEDDIDEYHQLIRLCKVLIDIYRKEIDYKSQINELIEILKISNKSFSVAYFQESNYSLFDFRILFCLAGAYKGDKQYSLSNKLLEFVQNSLDSSLRSSELERKLYTKVICALSYNHYNLDNYEMSLHYAEVGISFSINSSSMFHLSLLLARKAVAMLRLGQSGYTELFNQAITLFNIQGEIKTAEKWKQIIHDKYNITI